MDSSENPEVPAEAEESKQSAADGNTGPSDAERWDGKYRAVAGEPLDDPDPFVLAWLARMQRPGGAGKALDWAAGRGRHALLLAQTGWRVEAWDVSAEGLRQLDALAERVHMPVKGRCLDLMGADGELSSVLDSEAMSFDLICSINFLHRPHFEIFQKLLKPSGHLMLATFTTARPGKRPPLRYCLEPGELDPEHFQMPGLKTLEHWQSPGREGILAQRV